MTLEEFTTLNFQPGERIRIFVQSSGLPYEGRLIDAIEKMIIWESEQGIVQGKSLSEVIRLERIARNE